MKSRIDKIIGIIVILFWVGLIFEGAYIYINLSESSGRRTITEEERNNLIIEREKEKDKKKEEVLEEEFLPESFELDIPFVCQAPLGDWNPPFDHACEEATVLMAHYYLQNEIVDLGKAAQDIKDMVDFEEDKYGFYEDSSTAQTAKFIEDYYDYETEVYYDISLKDIKEELVQGNPIIVPTAGRLLGNPYFTPPGPIYHMLLVKGYNSDGFIVNDPGTSRGADYFYSYQVLEEAIHDWSLAPDVPDESIKNEKSAMIIVYPEKK